MGHDPPRRAAGPLAVAALALGALTLLGYVALLTYQGDTLLRLRTAVFALGITAATALAGLGLASAAHGRRLLAASAVAFAVLGLAGITSIGLPLVAAAALAGAAASRRGRGDGRAGVGTPGGEGGS